MRTVKIVPYHQQWVKLFQRAETELRTAFGKNLLALHHIGSTAIPGIPAKPVIDILSVVQDIEDVANCELALSQIGYDSRGEYGISGRRYFVKEMKRKRTHHVHCFEINHPAIERHLAFRDYLVAHPTEAKRYGELKIKLAERFRDERQQYAEGKSPLIEELLKKAMAWKANIDTYKNSTC